MTPKRKFYENGYQHLYQITFDKTLAFLTVPDMILLFTLICVKSIQYHIRITHVCIMLNHFHLQVSTTNKKDMELFVDAVTWQFALCYNAHYGLSGQLFKHNFGSSPKVKPNKIVGNMIYIANNPVEKKAVVTPWDYRWNFLRYAPMLDESSQSLIYSSLSRHPFSDEFNPLEASKQMLSLVKSINCKAKEGKPISYQLFDSPKYQILSEKEKKQLTDIIITSYNVIDYSPMLQKYGSVEHYCTVLREISGNEYDLNDDWEPEDYRHYYKMIVIAKEEGYDMRTVRYAGIEETAQDIIGPMMPVELANRLIERFRKEVGATDLEISKLLKIRMSNNLL